MQNLMKLQNGSDIRGIACEGVAGEEVNLTPEAGNLIGGAFAIWLGRKKGKATKELRIGIGHDSRITAQSLYEAAAEGLTSQGVTVYDCGLVSTPSMFMTTVFEEFRFDGSIMITASHLPLIEMDINSLTVMAVWNMMILRKYCVLLLSFQCRKRICHMWRRLTVFLYIVISYRIK